jgi:hypothetical protein
MFISISRLLDQKCSSTLSQNDVKVVTDTERRGANGDRYGNSATETVWTWAKALGHLPDRFCPADAPHDSKATMPGYSGANNTGFVSGRTWKNTGSAGDLCQLLHVAHVIHVQQFSKSR